MNKQIKELLNKQINAELTAAYQYLGFSNFFDSKNLNGYGNYYRVQAKEEIKHAMRIYDYLIKCNEKVSLLVIEAPLDNYKDIDEVLDAALQKEIEISNMISEIFETTQTMKDFASKIFIRWFIEEQQEEIADAQKMINDYQLFKNNLYELNEKYARRS